MNILLFVAFFCKPLVKPGHVSISTSSVIYGTTVHVVCDDGFVFPDGNFNKTIMCLAQGDSKPTAVWNSTIPICQRKTVEYQYQ